MPFFEWNLRHSNMPLPVDVKNSLFFPDFILDIVKNRGIETYQDFMEFAYPQILSLPSPFSLKNLDIAIARIQKAIASEEKILIFGDKDADGVTATSIMYRIIAHFNGDVSFRVPEGAAHYGISKTTIDEAKQSGISLIITVDCGITSVVESEYATTLGIDMIITDHHEPLDTLPQAFALINPKLYGYNFPYLSGSGVALKVAQALTESYLMNNYNQDLVFFDLETTGLDPEQDDIIEIAAVIAKNGIIIKTFQCLIQTEKTLNPKVVEITNITEKMLLEEGISITEALTKFLEFIENKTLVGHNIIGFDMKFLTIHLERHLNKKITNSTIDTLPISKTLYKQLKSHTLISIGKHLGIFVDHTSLHRALNDVILNTEVYRRMLLSQSHPILRLMSELILLAAIGTVADIMPLTSENRIIVHLGINQENVKLAPLGLLTLLRRLNISETLDSRAIGWTLGPMINSPGRLGQASLVVRLLTTNDPEIAHALTEEIFLKDQERKNLISSLEEEILASTNINNINKKKHLLITSSNISRGLTGLIATKLTNQFQVPVIIIALMDNNEASGSVRSTGTFDVVELLRSLSDLFLQFGGHKSAGGFVLSIDNIPTLEERLTKYMTTWETKTLRNSLDIDTELLDLSLLSIKNINYLKTLFSPTGCKNPFPNFLIKDVLLIEKKHIGKNKEHLLFTFQKNNMPFTVIAWGFSERWKTLKKYTHFDIVGIPEINDWNNNQEVRIQLIDIEGKSHAQCVL